MDRGPHCSLFIIFCSEISSYLGGQGSSLQPVHNILFRDFILPGWTGVLTAGLFMVFCAEISSYLGGQGSSLQACSWFSVQRFHLTWVDRGPHCRPVHGFLCRDFILPGWTGVLTAGLFVVSWFWLRVAHSIKD